MVKKLLLVIMTLSILLCFGLVACTGVVDPKIATEESYTVSFSIDNPGYGSLSRNVIMDVAKDTTITVEGNTIKIGNVTVTATPKASNSEFTYAFDSFEYSGTSIAGDVLVTAKFTRTVNEYDVIFKNEDGESLQSSKVKFGEIPAYNGETPTKAETDQYKYTFSSWDKLFTYVTGPVTYTAQFTSEVKVYEVTFKNEDGTILQNTNVPYGEVPIYEGATPTKEGNAENKYAFSSWDKEIVAVTGAATYTAQFVSTTNRYTVSIGVDNPSYGTVSMANIYSVPYGAKITVEGNTIKIGDIVVVANKSKDTAMYKYSFDKFEVAESNVTHNVNVVAKFSRELAKYDVVFKNKDGTVLQSEKITYGELPIYAGAVPTKAETDQYKYEFDGWNSAISQVYSDVTYIARFKAIVKEYTVVFKNEDGSILQSEKVGYGRLPLYKGETPTKEATVQYTFRFNGWDKKVEGITKDTTYVATYTSTLNKYPVSFYNDNGKLLLKAYVPYGETPVYTGETPTKEATAGNTYVFVSWGKELAPVTSECSYTAVFSATTNTYTVTIVSDDTEYGTVSVESVSNILYGSLVKINGSTLVIGENTITATPTAATAQYTYKFTKFDVKLGTITEDTTITAIFSRTINNYTISIASNEDKFGTVSESSILNVPYGTAITTSDNKVTIGTKEITGTPTTETTRAKYSFTEWIAPTTVTGNTSITANFAREFKAISLLSVGDKFEENFDNIDEGEFANYFVSTGHANVTLDNKALKVQKTAQWQGLKFQNMNFAKDKTYKFTFKLTVSQINSTDFFELLFADGTAEKVTQSLAPFTSVGNTVEVSFEIKLLADASELLIGCWSGDAIYTIDDLAIECVYPTIKLINIGDKYEENFDSIDGNEFANYFVSTGHANVTLDNKALKVQKTTTWQGLKFQNMNFAKDKTYKFTFKLTVSQMNSTDYFELLFADGTADKVSQSLASFVSMGNTVDVIFEITLKADATELLIGCWSGNAIYTIDNLAIECVVPESISVVDLTAPGSKFEENFDSISSAKFNYHFASTGHANVTVADKKLKVQKTTTWQGLKIRNISFAKDGTYRFTFKLTVSQMNSTDFFELLFADGTAEKVSQSLASFVSMGNTVDVSFEVKLLADATELLIGCWSGDAIYTIDDLTIACVYPTIDLKTVGSKYEQNFNSIDSTEFANYFVSTGHANVTLDNNALKVQKTAQWQGLKIQNISFAKDATYKFTFKLTVSQMSSTDFFELLFADGTADKVSQGLATFVSVGNTVEVSFSITLKANANEFLIGCWVGDAIYTIDDLTIEYVIPESLSVVNLTSVGDKFEENFNDMSDAKLAYYFVSTGSANISVDNKALKVQKTGIWQGLKTKNINFVGGATYKFTFKLNVTQMSDTSFFELLFADGTADKVSQSLASFVNVGNTVDVTFDITLKADATELLIGCYSANAIYTIDDLVIERIS